MKVQRVHFASDLEKKARDEKRGFGSQQIYPLQRVAAENGGGDGGERDGAGDQGGDQQVPDWWGGRAVSFTRGWWQRGASCLAGCRVGPFQLTSPRATAHCPKGSTGCVRS